MSENDILSELKYDNSVKSKLGWERWLMFECQTIDRAATEIERLRARVEVLERALHAAKDAMAAVSVPRDNKRAILFQAYDAALVALEAKP